MQSLSNVWRRYGGGAWVSPAIGLLVFACTFGVCRLTLPHLPAVDKDPATHERVLMASDVLIALLTAWGVVALRGCLGAFGGGGSVVSLARRWRVFVGFYAPLQLVLFLWWAGEWPGHIFTDEAAMFEASSLGQVEAWLSSAYSVLVFSVLRTFGHFTVISLFNTVCMSAIIADVLSVLVLGGLRRWVASAICVVLAFSVPLGLGTILLSHDTLSTVVRLGLFAIVVRSAVRRHLEPSSEIGWGTLAHVGALVVAGGVLRGENIVLPVSVGLALWLSRGAGLHMGFWRVAGAMMAAGAVLIGVQARVLPKLVDPSYNPEFKARYALTLMMQPLGFYVANKYWTPTPEDDLRVMGTVVDLEDLRQLYTPGQIKTYWIGASKGDVTTAEVAEVKKLFVRATLDNPGLFLGARASVVGMMLGASTDTLYPFYHLREELNTETLRFYNPAWASVEQAGMGIRQAFIPGLSPLTHAVRDATQPLGFRSAGWWIWNAFPAFFVMVGVFVSARRVPRAAACALVSALPLLLVFGVAPAAHFKYIFDLYVLGFLLVAVVVWDASTRWRVTARA